MRIVQFVIELDELTRGTAKRKVVCRGWERKGRGQLSLPSKSKLGMWGRAAAKTKSEQRYFR
jgi:hypothetical protein